MALRTVDYKWVALSNTTLAMLLATIDTSIVIVAMPDVFRGVHLNPLGAGNSFYLLWMIVGYLVVTSVLVVSFGRLGDIYGRVRMYTIGFAVYTSSSLLLTVDWLSGHSGAAYLVGFRLVQGIGAAFLLANAPAILTDAFPSNQRGLALGLMNVVGIAGMFLGLVLGGVLAPIDWRLIFLVSVPFGVFGTIWSHRKLKERGIRRRAPIDWLGNLTFAGGLILIMIGITYGIRPYGGAPTGWGNPVVIGSIAIGLALLAAFVLVEHRVASPMFRLSLFRIRPFTFGVSASFLSAIARGGLMFMLIIWLQGIWLPRHGYSFAATPLWAGLCMLPLTVGILLAGPTAGYLSDKFGARVFATGGMLGSALGFVLLDLLPIDFSYWAFAAILLLMGLSMGAFAAPNRAGVMNSLPAPHRGAGGGMNQTFQNSAQVLSIGIFFTLMINGLFELVARDALGWPSGPGRSGPRRGTGRPSAPDLRSLRGIPRVQPGEGAHRPARARAPHGGKQRGTHRPQLLPLADQWPLPERAARGVHLRDRRVSRCRGGLVVARRPLRSRGGARNRSATRTERRARRSRLRLGRPRVIRS